jgi:hypothetical protein
VIHGVWQRLEGGATVANYHGFFCRPAHDDE